MSPLRVAVVFASHGASDRTLYDWLDKVEALAAQPDIRRFRFPETNPKVHLWVNTAQQPAVLFHIERDGSFLVVDGEVYNLDEIAGVDRVETEDVAKTLLDLYRSRGEEVLKQLDASASIVVWDSRDERLLILRDRWGAVPSFFKEDSGVLSWASNIPTLLQIVGYEGVNLPALETDAD